jgi:Phosphotransferase enzyme family
MSSDSEIDAKCAELIGRAARTVRAAEPTRTQRLHSVCNDVFRLEFARGPAAIIKIYSRGHGADIRRCGDRVLKELATLRLLTARGVPVPFVEADDAEAQTPWLMMTCAGRHNCGSTEGLTLAEAKTVYRRCGELLARVHSIGGDAQADAPSLATYDPTPAEVPPLSVDPGFRWALEKVAMEGRVTPTQLARIRYATRRPEATGFGKSVASPFHSPQKK